MKKAQKFPGNPPSDGELIAENNTWALYDRFAPSGEWQNLKLVSKQPVAIKANYWLAWNGQRFAKCRDVALLDEHRPELMEWLVERLSS